MMVAHIPPADVEPVRCREWIEDDYGYYNNSRSQSKTKWMPPSKFREASMMKY